MFSYQYLYLIVLAHSRELLCHLHNCTSYYDRFVLYVTGLLYNVTVTGQFCLQVALMVLQLGCVLITHLESGTIRREGILVGLQVQKHAEKALH